MEVQNHGIVFEDIVISSITGMSKEQYQTLLENSYTHSMDIVKGLHSDHDYSIKVSKNGASVGCGDILRFMDHTLSKPFIMVVGVWRQKDQERKVYTDIYEFYFDPKHHQLLWSGLERNALEPFVAWVKAIPPYSQGLLQARKEWKIRREQLYAQYGKGLVRIDAKIDSKKQRRVQCSIKLAELIAAGVEYKKYSSDYQGVYLPYEQKSSPRSFSKT